MYTIKTMLQAVVACLFLMEWSQCEEDVPGILQYRVSESEFNKVAGALVHPPNGYIVYNDQVRVDGDIGNTSYSLYSLKTLDGTPDSVSASVPQDDYIKAEARFSSFRIGGSMKLSSSQSEFSCSGAFKATLTNVQLTAEGTSKRRETIHLMDKTTKVILKPPECNVQFDSFTFDDNEITKSINMHLTSAELHAIFNETVCKMYGLKFDFGFGVPPFKVSVMNTTIYTIYSRPLDMRVRNRTLIIYNTMVTEADDAPPTVNDEMTTSTSAIDTGPRDTPHPFEILMSADIVNNLAKRVLEYYGIGKKEIPLTDLFGSIGGLKLDQSLLNKLLHLVPEFGKTFPNSDVSLVLTGANAYLNITDTAVRLEATLSIDARTKLRCNNKTYTGFSFNANIYVPAQIGINNKLITFKLLGFGGNITITGTKIGRIADRFLVATFYSLPQVVGFSYFETFSKKFLRVKFRQVLPAGLYLIKPSVSLAKNMVLIGGELSTTDPRLPAGNMTWIGQHQALSSLIFPMYDNTPNNATRLPEQNCTKPPVSAALRPTSGYIKICVVIILWVVTVVLEKLYI